MKGLSLLEIVVVIAIGLTLVLMANGAFSKFRDAQILDGNASELATLIRETRAKAIASRNFSQQGVHFETSRAVTFEGAGFLEPNPDNEEFKLSALIEISSINLMDGSTDIVFQKFTGETGQYGTITLRNKNNPSKIKTIKIEPTGIISTQ